MKFQLEKEYDKGLDCEVPHTETVYRSTSLVRGSTIGIEEEERVGSTKEGQIRSK